MIGERNSSGTRARQFSRRSTRRARNAGASRRTVLIAAAANAIIAVAKLAGGLISGSTALLAEAAHSVADTTNQLFLLASISLAQRAPTEGRPFGHGQQRFLWTFLAAVGMFVAGATFALGYGTVELLRGGESGGGFGVAWAALAVALVAEGASWLRALRQTRAEAARGAGDRCCATCARPGTRTSRWSCSRTAPRCRASRSRRLGIGLDQLTGSAMWDPAASVAIGLLLIGVAVWMGRDTAGLLIGAAARPDERAQIERVLEDDPHVIEVAELLTMALGPNALLVAARVDLEDGVEADEIERAMSALEERLQDAVPDVTEVFLDPTPGRRSPADTAREAPHVAG